VNPDEHPRPTERTAPDEARGAPEAGPHPATGPSENVPHGEEDRWLRDMVQELHRLQQENNALLRALLDRLLTHE
jgi:hypothetical protein